MSARAEPGHSPWWRRVPIRRWWKRWFVLLIVGGVLIEALYLVPIAHAQSQGILVVIPIPTQAGSPTCTDWVFNESGTYSFTWVVPNQNPTTLTVESPVGGALYNASAVQAGSGSFLVAYPHELAYRFCLSVHTVVATGPTSVVTVNGKLSYSTSAPLL
jgi:hypothetical protein